MKVSRVGKNAQREPYGSRQIDKVGGGPDQEGISAGRGFSLLELMTIIAIILVMASFSAPIYNRILTRSH